jgi:hypothetical protein
MYLNVYVPHLQTVGAVVGYLRVHRGQRLLRGRIGRRSGATSRTGQNARRLFEKQESREKRRLLNFVVSNSTWKGKKLEVSLQQPFDLLLETAARAEEAGPAQGPIAAKSEIWLPGPECHN